MAKFKIGLQLVTTPIDIKRAILKEIEVVLNKAALITEKIVYTKALNIFIYSLENCPEIKSLKGGLLQAELGPIKTDVDIIIKNIINEIVSTFEFKVDYYNSVYVRPKLQITMSVFPYNSITKLINDIGASYKTDKSVNIPWLEWLLLRGDVPIISNYYVSTSGNLLNSRTGLAVMKRSKTSAWRVPPQFSGVEKNNFITRALDNVADNVVDILIETFIKNVQ